jgi:hypothetical protein
MIRKDLIFIIIIIAWLIFGIFQVIIKELRIFNFIPLLLLSFIVVSKIFIPKYNNWLESTINKKELTIKEIRLKKLKSLKRYNFLKI